MKNRIKNRTYKRKYNNIQYKIVSILLIISFVVIQPTENLTNTAFGKTTLTKDNRKSSFLNSYIPSVFSESEVTTLEEGTFVSLDFFPKAKQREYYHNNKTEDSVSISFDTQNQWGESAVCEVKIRNNTSKTVDLSDIAFTVDGKITSIWNASIQEEEPYESVQNYLNNSENLSDDSNANLIKSTKADSESNNYYSYNLKPQDYNNLINPGSEMSFGYIIKGEGQIPSAPVSFILKGDYISTSTTESYKPTILYDSNANPSVKISFKSTSFYNKHIEGKIIVENIGENILSDWSFSFEFAGIIENVWNGNLSKNSLAVKGFDFQYDFQ